MRTFIVNKVHQKFYLRKLYLFTQNSIDSIPKGNIEWENSSENSEKFRKESQMGSWGKSLKESQWMPEKINE